MKLHNCIILLLPGGTAEMDASDEVTRCTFVHHYTPEDDDDFVRRHLGKDGAGAYLPPKTEGETR